MGNVNKAMTILMVDDEPNGFCSVLLRQRGA
jgi:hypothetical protein